MMKMTLLLLLFASTLAAWEPPFRGDARPPRRIEIGKKSAFRSAPGKDPVIVVAPGSPATVRFAAEELQQQLSKKLKREIQIADAPAEGKYPIILGLNPLSAAEGVKPADLCRDSFVIRITPKSTVIAGRDDGRANPKKLLKKGDHLAKIHCFERGTYFGVLDFLERFAGVRFYFPHEDFIVVPPGELELPEADIFDRPDFEVRWHSPTNGYYDDPAMPGATVKGPSPVKTLNWYRNRMQTVYTPNNHGLHHLQIYKRFGKTHPEYLAETPMRDGKGNPVVSDNHFCYTHGLKEVIAQDAIAYFQGKSSTSRGISRWSTTQAGNGVFSVMPSDGMYQCRCPGCQKYYTRPDGKGGSDLIWQFTADIANALSAAKVPGWISQNAYAVYKEVPSCDIPENVMVTLCAFGPWAVGDPAGLKKEYQLIRDWRKKAGKPLIMWNYALKYSGTNPPWIPDSTPRAIAKYYQDNAPHICGMFMESGTDFYLFHYLTYYILGKVAWDNRTNVDALMKEHFQLLYGPAADLMMAFFDRLEYLWLHRVNGQIIETALGPTQGTVGKKELYEEIYNDRELAEMKKTFDKAADLCAVKNYQQKRRVDFIRKHFLGALEAGLADYRNFGSARSEFGMDVPEVKTIAVDGNPEDAGWKTVRPGFLQKFSGILGGKTPHPTRFKVCRDAKNLYCLFECVEPEYDQRVVSLPGTKGHDPYHDDGVELFLKSDIEGPRYYQVILNSAGVLWMKRWKTMGGRFYDDPPWQPEVKASVGRTDSGWCAEIAIPLESLEKFDGKIIRANFCRHRRTSEESYSVWSPFLIKKFHEPENFGNLFFVPRPAKESLLLNPDFLGEKKGTRVFTGGGWGITQADSDKGSITLDKEHFVYGGQSLRLAEVKKGERTGVVQSLKGKLKPNTDYRLSFYVRCDGVLRMNNHPTSGAWVNVAFGKHLQVPPVGFSGTFPWRYHTFRFKTPAELKSCYVSIRLNNASGAVNFDRVTLEEIR